MKKILIIEDEPTLIRILQSYLERDGFSVVSSNRGDSGLDLALTENPDLILLDLNLPGLDGIEVATHILKVRPIPIIMVTARVEEIDRLKGLELGADDYICKPYSPKEVVARVKTVLRRFDKKEKETPSILASDISIDVDMHIVKRKDEVIDLTPSEFLLLQVMAKNPGRVFSRLQLLEAIQDQVYEGYERTIDAHIKNLRSKLEQDPKKPRYIETVFGVGYRFSREYE